jgi:hypothetical protein
MAKRCIKVLRRGRCEDPALAGSNYCGAHDPEGQARVVLRIRRTVRGRSIRRKVARKKR